MSKPKGNQSNLVSGKSKKTKGKGKTPEPEIEQETIEFVWSTQVSNAWNRMKYQLEHPLEGRIPPIPGITDFKKDIYISQLVQMYADVLCERWNKKQLQLWAQYDESSLEHVVRNFWSPSFMPRRIILPEIVDSNKSDDAGKTPTDKKNKKQPDKTKPEKPKAPEKKKKKATNDSEPEKAEAPVIPPEKWKIKVPCMNIFPQLYLTPSLLSLISEPAPDKPAPEPVEAKVETKKGTKKGAKSAKNVKQK